MSKTPVSLLERLRARPDDANWRQLDGICRPWIVGWLKGRGISNSDADDLAQEVMSTLARELATFEHNGRPGALRTWLRTTASNRLRGFLRDGRAERARRAAVDFNRLADELADPHSGLSKQWDREHNRYVADRLIEVVRPAFDESTWAAFAAVVIDGGGTSVVAARLGMTPNAVYIAKSRVLQRLRHEWKGWID